MFVLNGNIRIELLHVEIAERADVGKQLEMQRGSAAQWLSRGPSGLAGPAFKPGLCYSLPRASDQLLWASVCTPLSL